MKPAGRKINIALPAALLAAVLIGGILSAKLIQSAGKPGAEVYTALDRTTTFEEEAPRTVIPIPETEEYLIVVRKEAHTLELYRNGKQVRSWPCSVRNELPDRTRENDGQTPEGVFTIWQLAIVDPWARWMALNTVDKARGIFIDEYPGGEEILRVHERKYGRITTDADIRRFNRKHPDTPYLRGFGIHGGGYSPGRDWTIGCPALNDADVIELYNLIKTNPRGGMGTTVIITD